MNPSPIPAAIDQRRSRRSRVVRLAVIAVAGTLMFLAGRPAHAWVPTPNRARVTPAHQTARYVPDHSRADPASSRPLPVAFLSLSSSRRPGLHRVWLGGAAPASIPGLADEATGSPRDRIRSVSSFPSHWCAIHLSI